MLTPCNEVMHRLSDFIDGYNLVAHNASFVSKDAIQTLNFVE